MLRRSGTPMHHEFDLIIGVTTIAHEMILVTDNMKDFRHLKNLKSENWLEKS
jgi:tRNA(fMet)-specific endonuclease VapC